MQGLMDYRNSNVSSFDPQNSPIWCQIWYIIVIETKYNS